jgi:hypothetical protein
VAEEGRVIIAFAIFGLFWFGVVVWFFYSVIKGLLTPPDKPSCLK